MIICLELSCLNNSAALLSAWPVQKAAPQDFPRSFQEAYCLSMLIDAIFVFGYPHIGIDTLCNFE